ncbi:TraR/DksA family transcriptional regulator [Patescibacteria group bacterium]
MSLDKNKVEKFKGMLEEERDKIRKEIEGFASPSDNPDEFKTNHNELGTHQDESATEVEEYVDNLSVESNLEQRLKDIKSALTRVEDGAYGKCVECGGDIREERLEIYPSARRCMQCNK